MSPLSSSFSSSPSVDHPYPVPSEHWLWAGSSETLYQSVTSGGVETISNKKGCIIKGVVKNDFLKNFGR